MELHGRHDWQFNLRGTPDDESSYDLHHSQVAQYELTIFLNCQKALLAIVLCGGGVREIGLLRSPR